jgi:hypothetical protein
LDMHARKVVAGVLDGQSGRAAHATAPTLPEETLVWLETFPRRVRVAYEAGPMGYGLAHACAAAGIACIVAARSKIQRAAGDGVKTDRRDAARTVRVQRCLLWAHTAACAALEHGFAEPNLPLVVSRCTCPGGTSNPPVAGSNPAGRVLGSPHRYSLTA